VIRNLVRNAIQHSGGRILIGVRRQGADIAITVADDGPGVPAEARKEIFEPFYQIPGGGRRSAGNVGLGLSIVAELVRAMGGDVSLQSIEGRGAAFRVILPASMAAGRITQPSAPVLVIDDDDDAANAAIEALNEGGRDATRYEGPLTAEAISRAAQDAAGPVFLDYHLGGSVTAADVLALSPKDSRPQITVITSDSSPTVATTIRDLGAARLLKPLRRDQIDVVLGRL